jgi:hypothetical protein
MIGSGALLPSRKDSPMSYEVILRYDPSLIRHSVVRYWWRIVGIRFVIAIIALAGCLSWLVSQGDRSWFVGMLATVVVLGLAFMIAIYVVHYRNGMQILRRMGDSHAMLTLTESSFSVNSAAGSSTLPWSAVTDVTTCSGFWLLYVSKSQFATLPLADFGPDARSFFLERVRAAGGKVITRGTSSDGSM